MIRMTHYIYGIIIFVISSNAFAVQCGDVITQSIVLQQDLHCEGEYFALAVGAGNITIDLNGHTLFGETISPQANGGNRIFHGILYSSSLIINVDIPHTERPARVKIKGPGIIDGFGISVAGGSVENWIIRDLTIRNAFVGVFMSGGNHVIRKNEVLDTQYGIYLTSQKTSVERNAFTNFRSTGILLISDDTAHNTIIHNSIRRGTSFSSIGMKLSDGAHDNLLTGNQVSAVAGAGLAILQARDNTIGWDAYSDCNIGILISSQLSPNDRSDYDSSSNEIQYNLFANNTYAMIVGGGSA